MYPQGRIMITAALLTLLFIIHKANSLALNRTDIIDCSENPDLCYQGPAGPPGPPGERGPTGPAGPPGPSSPVPRLRATVRKMVYRYLKEMGASSDILSADGSALPEPVNCNNFIGFKVIREDLEALSIIHGGSATGYEVSNYTILDGFFNEGNHFDLTTGRFTVPEDGIYRFDLLVMLTLRGLVDDTSGAAIISYIAVERKNGLKETLSVHSISDLAPFSQTLSGLMKLKRGQYVSVIVLNQTLLNVKVHRVVFSGNKVN